jgi:starch phosphorylase
MITTTATTTMPARARAGASVPPERPPLERALLDRLLHLTGTDPAAATARDWFTAVVSVARDRVMERWQQTERTISQTGAKRICYFSMEFLIGRLLSNSLLNLGADEEFREALDRLGLDLDRLCDLETDAGLGNGGLGRLAACFLDSMATLSLPSCGYGIRYENGMFRQEIEGGRQVERPDNWLRDGYPWELPRRDVSYRVRFGGRVVHSQEPSGALRFDWVDTDDVVAMAYDVPIPGYGTGVVSSLRLWSAKPARDFDLRCFNQADYVEAFRERTAAENLSRVLYPDDSTIQGRELRLKQQYFFVSASLQDILRRFFDGHGRIDDLPDAIAIQLNDTHPSLAIPELMRVLVDEHRLGWDRAWQIVQRTFSYTNHTLMPEALETWPVAMFERVLPRHLEIVYEINRRFLDEACGRGPEDPGRAQRLSIVDDAGGPRLRMAHLATIGSHRVNGVSAIHTDLMKTTAFAEFDRQCPGRIVSITNGISPRRWLIQANPQLAALITDYVGDRWTRDLSALHDLAPLSCYPDFRAQFRAVKHANKQRLADIVRRELNIGINPHSMFDVHIKRMHEYKRQLLNVLHLVIRYNRIREGRDDGAPARTAIFSGKAAPGYAAAKRIVSLIHAVAEVVNHDRTVGDRLKVVFVPDYGVSTAERIVPACDLSEQISTAGTEASGTGNMKLALNGALTIGTLDGANVEIRAEVGEDNMFIFGSTAGQVAARRRSCAAR